VRSAERDVTTVRRSWRRLFSGERETEEGGEGKEKEEQFGERERPTTDVDANPFLVGEHRPHHLDPKRVGGASGKPLTYVQRGRRVPRTLPEETELVPKLLFPSEPDSGQEDAHPDPVSPTPKRKRRSVS